MLAGVIVAKTGQCGAPTQHSIYVSVYEHLEWIEIIAGKGHCVRYIEQCTIL